jgi:hypothetical protein
LILSVSLVYWQEGSESFWEHPRLHTSVFFEPAPIEYSE